MHLKIFETQHPCRPARATRCLAIAIIIVSLGMARPSCAEAQDLRPNVILMMADDLGFRDLHCYGGERQQTPVLDQLAKDGLRLTSFYAGCTICTPSRMALMSGAYPPRVGWRGGVVGYGVNPQNGLAPEVLTLGELFQSAGYATGLVGKWHLGDTGNMLPMHQGFETAFYVDKSNNQSKKLWRNGELIEDPFDNQKLSERFASECVDFIHAHAKEPFFLYVPFTAPHFPAQAHPDWKGHSGNDAYGDVVEELDARVGEILQALQDDQLVENTIVVFTSDNGVEPGQRKWASASPYRGLKWSCLEGGNRVPCLIRWPAKVPAGKETGAIVGAIDLYPTLAHACGIQLESNERIVQKLDGTDILSVLTEPSEESVGRDTFLYFQGWGTLQAIRVGDWKLIVDVVKEIPDSEHGPVLFQLAKDPAEQHNLSADHPERVATMLKEASKQLADIQSNSIQLGGPKHLIREQPPAPKWIDNRD